MRQKVQMPPVDEQDEFDQLRQSRHQSALPGALRRRAGASNGNPTGSEAAVAQRPQYISESPQHSTDHPHLVRQSAKPEPPRVS